ncbi:MAG: hypothetical protein M1840_001924 [Geoglossum simile]|nr:MAG: hypothetical protein M1840_001924 [Geoglossum simile]
MAAQAELQSLLRFLSGDAKIPLASAMGKSFYLYGFDSVSAISKADLQTIHGIFADDKLSKQVLNAAKRVTKKRSAADALPPSSPSPTKRKKTNAPLSDALTSTEMEHSLELPLCGMDEEGLSKVVLFTNRAPLVLAFAVAILKHEMPHQPLSSRLSLAQAVVSANSRSKAVSLGLEKGKSAEEEGWGQGQPSVKIMGREVRVLRRWDYSQGEESSSDPKGAEEEGKSIAGTPTATGDPTSPALWGLDLEALRQANTSQPSSATSRISGELPIYTAQAARSYLLKSFATAPPPTESPSEPPKKKKSPSAIAAEKEHNLGLLLGALDLLYGSWSCVLTREELDRRAWGWYVNVRPDVETGVAGWGGKGEVRLADILNLKRKI